MTFAKEARIVAKVGVSKDPKGRVKAVQTGCPYEILGLYAAAFSSRSAAMQAESSVHYRLRRWGTRGEWFSLPLDAVDELFAAIEAVAGQRLERVPFMTSEVLKPRREAA